MQRAPSAPAADKAKPPGASFNDYADLINGFQDLAAAAINNGGRGLDSAHFGKDLGPAHRVLLENVRRALILGQEPSPASKQQAAAMWPALATKLKAALEEARHAGIPGQGVAACLDDIAMIGEHYLHAPLHGPSELETPEDYIDVINAMRDLLYEFSRMEEGSETVTREEVQGRPDHHVSMATRELNAGQRAKLAAVKLGSHANERHRALIEKLRRALTLARTEAPGSAYQAVALWQSISGELEHMVQRATVYAERDFGDVLTSLADTGFKLARHYELVHREDIDAALKAEPQAGRAEAEKVAGAASPAVQAAMIEQDQFADFRHALDVIQHNLTRVPGRPAEWLLTSGSTQIRVRDDEVQALKTLAAKELHDYMRDLAKKMAAIAMNYDSIKEGNSSWKLHVLAGWGGAEDPGDQDHWRASVIRVRDTLVYPAIERGELVEAFDRMMSQKYIVDAREQEVGDWDSDLDVGYNRLARSMQVVQVALVSLVPVAGEAAIAGGATVWAVGGTAVAAGGGGAALGETGRELASGESLDAGKIAHAGRAGAAIGMSAVSGPATKALGGALGSAEGGVQGLIADTTAAGTVNAGQAVIAGDDPGKAFIGGAAGSLGGRAVKAGGPLTENAVVGTVASAGVGAGTAALTGDDWMSGAAGGLAGHVGGLVEPPTAAPKPGPAPAEPGGGAVPAVPAEHPGPVAGEPHEGEEAAPSAAKKDQGQAGAHDVVERAVNALPDETVMSPPDPRNAADARLMYENSVADRSREAAIYRNTETGDYIVIQGDAEGVAVAKDQGPRRGGVQQRWKELLDLGADVGRWQLLAHSHPSSRTTGVVDPVNMWPSGAKGDMGIVWADARRSGARRSSRIDYLTRKGPDHTDFGVDFSSDKPIWVDLPSDESGGRTEWRFNSMEEFHEFMRDVLHAPQGDIPAAMSSAGAPAAAGAGQTTALSPPPPAPGGGSPSQSPPSGGGAGGGSAAPQGEPYRAVTEPAGGGPAERTEPGPGPRRQPAPTAETLPASEQFSPGPRGSGRPGTVQPQTTRLTSAWREIPPPEGVQGSNERIFLEDPLNRERWLFKPADPLPGETTGGEAPMAYGDRVGIEAGERWRRAMAAASLAGELGFDTPEVHLVEWGGRRGSLQRWREGYESGAATYRNKRGEFMQFWNSQRRLDMDAFDFFIANQDRNGWNYMIRMEGGEPRLLLIDQDASIPNEARRNYQSQEPGTGHDPEAYVRDLPPTISRDLEQRLRNLEAAFPETELRQWLTQPEVDGLRARLGVLIGKLDSGQIRVVP